MKITQVRTTPLSLPYRETYHTSFGTAQGTTVILVEVETDEGVTGIGETVGWASADTSASLLRDLSYLFIGESPYNIERLLARAFRVSWFSNTPRFGNQVLAGLEMALWDIIGKAAGQPVHRLLGGAAHDYIQYFAFLQGGTPEELAEDARQAVAAGYDVIYMKIGWDEENDIRCVAAVRQAIGEGGRLRVDPNEAWDVLTAIRMIRRLEEFRPEFIEQPVPSHSLEALAQVRASVSVPIAADQSIYTLADVYRVCQLRAADVIVLGPHETGGLLGLKKAAAIAQAAAVNICVHGVRETGITTCAANQVLATIPNLDDGNQIMCQLLQEDIIASPDLTLTSGRLGIVQGPGLGFELDGDAVARGVERYRQVGVFANR